MAEIFEKKHENPFFLNTGPYGDTPFRLLKVEISKIGLGHVLRWSRIGLESKIHDHETYGGFGKRGQNLSRIFNTGQRKDPHVKIKTSKVGLLHVLSWPKLGLEPKCHDPGTFGGFGKQITHTQKIHVL